MLDVWLPTLFLQYLGNKYSIVKMKMTLYQRKFNALCWQFAFSFHSGDERKNVNHCQINLLYNFFEFIHSLREDDFFNILICMQFDILDQFLKGMIYIVLEKNPATLWHLVLQWVVWLLQS